MNQSAIFRSFWEEGTVETNCEVTPSGEIINIDTVYPQFDAMHLVSEEVELKNNGKVFQLTTDEDGEPEITIIKNLKDQYRSIGWLHSVNRTINLSPVLHANSLPTFVNVTLDEFDLVRDSEDRMKGLAVVKLHNLFS